MGWAIPAHRASRPRPADGTVTAPMLDRVRYEVLPFSSAESAVAAVDRPVTLTVTCSPRTGMDAALDIACRLRALGHTVVLHMAARMVKGPRHLDDLLERMADGGIADVFLVAGDAPEPIGARGALRGTMNRVRLCLIPSNIAPPAARSASRRRPRSPNRWPSSRLEAGCRSSTRFSTPNSPSSRLQASPDWEPTSCRSSFAYFARCTLYARVGRDAG